MTLQDLVHAFNALSRSAKTPSGLVDNHWHFSIRHIPWTPSGDILQVVNPASRFIVCEGPSHILSRETTAERAEIVLPMLLKSFTEPQKSTLEQGTPVFGPWSWGTDDVELAKALEKRLKSAGVRKELRVIRVGDEASSKIAQEVWDSVLEKLVESSGSQCGNCKSAAADDVKLLRCSGCNEIEYCSKACQKSDWKVHKALCKIDPINYWTVITPRSFDAKALAADVGLKLGSGGLVYPIRRLVATGKDSPENFRKLLGWNGKDEIKATHQRVRREVLLRPPRGSPSWKLAQGLQLDENCPEWTPRPASAAEEKEIQEIRDMQELIKRHMGSRSISTIDVKDMQEVLVKNFASELSVKMQTYHEAVNAMDQGRY